MPRIPIADDITEEKVPVNESIDKNVVISVRMKSTLIVSLSPEIGSYDATAKSFEVKQDENAFATAESTAIEIYSDHSLNLQEIRPPFTTRCCLL